jgi:predicted transcriptional regulator
MSPNSPLSKSNPKFSCFESRTRPTSENIESDPFGNVDVSGAKDVATQLVTNEFSGIAPAASDGRALGVITESDVVRPLIEKTAGELDCRRRNN